MIRASELIEAIAALRPDDLDVWVRDALVTPQEASDTLMFSDMQAARVRLICVLRYDLEIDAGALPVVLSLIDQLHEARGRLMALGAAVAAQDDAVREAIIEAISARGGDALSPNRSDS
jgi:chaperone modulatory protein CbpM